MMLQPLRPRAFAFRILAGRMLAGAMLMSLGAVSAAAETRRIAVAPFQSLDVAGRVIVELVDDPSTPTTADGESAALDTLTTTVSDGVLHIRTTNAETTSPLRVRMPTQPLARVALAGESELQTANLSGERLSFALSGSAILVATVTASDTIAVMATGDASATLAGTAPSISISTSANAQIDAAALSAHSLRVVASGDSAGRYQARDSARISATGHAHVYVAGAPRCMVDNNGDAEITCGDQPD